MLKAILTVAGLLALAGRGTFGAAEAAGSGQPPLRWAADAEGGAPYIFKDPDKPDKDIGFEVDLAEALAEELGRKIDFVQYQFGSLVPGLQRRDFDLAMNGLEITPDRARVVRFSHPYYVYTLQLVARADETRFETPAQCRALGGVVGTLEDTAAERLLDELQVNILECGDLSPLCRAVRGLPAPVATLAGRPLPNAGV